MTTMSVSGWMFLLVPYRLGNRKEGKRIKGKR